MKIEVLVATMYQETIDFYKKLNIETDLLIVNQSDHNGYEEVIDDGKRIRMITSDTRGLGRSRNLALLNSQADIVVICDDDEVFESGYSKVIEEEFSKHPQVDFFIFKTIIYQDGKEIIKVKEEKDLKIYNSLKYGSVHFAFRRKEVLRRNIFFSTYFGAGTENGSGEDSLFIRDCFKQGMKIRTSNKLIARIYNDNSTWFEGYNEKFFYDKGKLSKALFPRMWRLYIEQFLQRHKEYFDKIDKSEARKLMINGANDFGGRE